AKQHQDVDGLDRVIEVRRHRGAAPGRHAGGDSNGIDAVLLELAEIGAVGDGLGEGIDLRLRPAGAETANSRIPARRARVPVDVNDRGVGWIARAYGAEVADLGFDAAARAEQAGSREQEFEKSDATHHAPPLPGSQPEVYSTSARGSIAAW